MDRARLDSEIKARLEKAIFLTRTGREHSVDAAERIRHTFTDTSLIPLLERLAELDVSCFVCHVAPSRPFRGTSLIGKLGVEPGLLSVFDGVGEMDTQKVSRVIFDEGPAGPADSEPTTSSQLELVGLELACEASLMVFLSLSLSLSLPFPLSLAHTHTLSLTGLPGSSPAKRVCCFRPLSLPMSLSLSLSLSIYLPLSLSLPPSLSPFPSPSLSHKHSLSLIFRGAGVRSVFDGGGEASAREPSHPGSVWASQWHKNGCTKNQKHGSTKKRAYKPINWLICAANISQSKRTYEPVNWLICSA